MFSCKKDLVPGENLGVLSDVFTLTHWGCALREAVCSGSFLGCLVKFGAEKKCSLRKLYAVTEHPFVKRTALIRV
jgi:hypothetical protein